VATALALGPSIPSVPVKVWWYALKTLSHEELASLAKGCPYSELLHYTTALAKQRKWCVSRMERLDNGME
jgi:hypothetical protein